MTKSDNNHQKSKGVVCFLPNMLTSAGLFAAFYSIIAALKGEFEASAIAIFVAMLLDTLDGRVARMTNSESEFGAQYDSLADMVSFGIAPSLVIYSWSLHSLGKLGWLAAFIYTACAALRLARFNTKSVKNFFQGLPSTSGGGIIASLVWVGSQNSINSVQYNIIVMLICISVAILMVSNIRFYSFKDLELKGRLPFIFGLLNILIFIAIALNPPVVLFLVFSSYACSGPILTVVMFYRMKKSATKKTP